MNHPEREEGELEKEEIQKLEKAGEETSEYTKRVPTIEWPCRNADLYEKVHQVGEGTFGKVYKAKIKSLPVKSQIMKSDYVALKRILMENEKEGFPITAIREIMILKRLSHPNIISLLEVVTSKPSEKNKFRGNVYLVFEYMEHDLSGLVDLKINFNIPQIKCILFQILTGISYLHTNNVIHRDIKGANILINNRGDVKIADFGLARIHNPNPNVNKIYTNRVVTLWYRAPELLLGSTNYGPAIDMWSVGCLFSELLTGVPPFRSNKENEQIEKIFEKCGTPTEETWPGLTSLRHYSAAPKVMYPNILRTYYSDNKLVDEVAFNLLLKMLELNPNKRISAKDALEHQFFKETHIPRMCNPEDLPKIDVDSHEFQSRQNKQKQQAVKTGIPHQISNVPQKPKEKIDIVVSKQGYNQNPNYYSKNTTKQIDYKLKFEDSQLNTVHGSVMSNSITHSSRLEALYSSCQPNENSLLNNKRYNEPSINDGEANAMKKQKQSPPGYL